MVIRMGRLEDNKKIKKDALLDAAFTLFTTKGINKTSISDIVSAAGVAKGTFYLYFVDKYDLRDKLIVHKSNEIFYRAEDEASKLQTPNLEEHIVAMIDNILNQFVENTSLLNFIAKNLSWGIFTNAVSEPTEENSFYEIYKSMFQDSTVKYEKPEIMMYIIIEMVSSGCYGPILNEEPVSIVELKPYLLRTVRQIMRAHRID